MKSDSQQQNAGCLGCLVVVVLLFLAARSACDRQPSATTTPEKASTQLTAAEVLATRSNADLADCKNLLKRLTIKCMESDKEIVGAAIAVENQLEGIGFSEELFPIIEGLDEVIPATSGNSFARNCAAYLTLRRDGNSHRDACRRVPLFLATVKGIE